MFCFIELLFDPGWYRPGTSFLGVLIIVRYYAFSTLVFNSPVLTPSHGLDIYTCSLHGVFLLSVVLLSGTYVCALSVVCV